MSILSTLSFVHGYEYHPSLQRWYVNGEIKCFSGSHIALTVLAILVLMVALAVTVLVLVANTKWNTVSS